jgi:uncharacterized membrane protein
MQSRIEMIASYIDQWLEVVLRWAHVVIAMTWIGTSIYFVRLDLMLERPEKEAAESGAMGELWSAHGGGIYYSRKYPVPPPGRAEEIHLATPWPAWATWLTGLGMMIIVYYWNPQSELIDTAVTNLSAPVAIALSALIIVSGWFVYDVICRTLRYDRAISAAVFGLVCLVAWISFHLFSAPAAWHETGAVMGTIMAANVFFVINPAHNRLIAMRTQGLEPDAVIGQRAKQRSVHNSYLTLPVVIAMLGGHFPIVYQSSQPLVAVIVLGIIGALTRHFFIAWHQKKHLWGLAAFCAVAFVALAWAITPR